MPADPVLTFSHRLSATCPVFQCWETNDGQKCFLYSTLNISAALRARIFFFLIVQGKESRTGIRDKMARKIGFKKFLSCNLESSLIFQLLAFLWVVHILHLSWLGIWVPAGTNTLA